MSRTTEAAVDHYHDLLTSGLALETWQQLEQGIRDRRLVFGERPVCTVLRPYFLSCEDRQTIESAAALVLSAIHRVFAAIDPRDYESVLGLSDGEAALARIACGFEPVETIARLDGFLERSGAFRFIEFNAESPGGIAFGRSLAELFDSLPVMARFRERFTAESDPVLDRSLDALLATYRAWGGRREQPRVAIVDWTAAPTRVEFEMCRDALARRGVEAVIVDPAELEYERGRLRHGAFEIDLVYRRLVASEIPPKLGLDIALVRAARDDAVCIASGFAAFALTSKILFAILSDESLSPALTREERQAVRAHVPWTRVVRDAATEDWEGRRVDLLDYAAQNRERLVLKPATEYGGAGVVLGWTVDAEVWSRALRTALDTPYVLQHRVALPTEPFPVAAEGGVAFVDFLADIDPYAFNGETSHGAGTRLSRSQLLNVTAGGGSAAPVFTVSARD